MSLYQIQNPSKKENHFNFLKFFHQETVQLPTKSHPMPPPPEPAPAANWVDHEKWAQFGKADIAGRAVDRPVDRRSDRRSPGTEGTDCQSLANIAESLAVFGQQLLADKPRSTAVGFFLQRPSSSLLEKHSAGWFQLKLT